MGTRSVANGRRVETKISEGASAYKKILNLARTVVANMTAAVATFATPVPALADVTDAADDLKAAVTPLGHKRNRASKAAKLNCQEKASVVHLQLLALASYVKNTALAAAAENSPLYNSIVASSGFGLKNFKQLAPICGPVRNVSQTNSGLYGAKTVRLSWKKPRGLIHGLAPAAYNIKIKGVILQTVVATNTIISTGYLDTVTGRTPVEIVPFNSRGEGAAITAIIIGPVAIHP